MHPLRRRAITALVLVNVLWGLSFPVMTMINRLIEQRASPSAAAGQATGHAPVARLVSASFYMTLRFAIAVVLLALVMPRLFWPMRWSEWFMGAATGLGFSGGFLLQVMALHEISASRSGFLTSLSVLFTPLLMVVLERRTPSWSVIAGAALALAGMSVLTGICELGVPFGVRLAADATDRFGWGDALTVLAAFIFAIEIILIDVFSRRMPSAKLSPGMFMATLAIGAGGFAAGSALGPSTGPLAFWAGLVFDPWLLCLTVVTSVLCTVLAFHWMNKYQAYVSPAHAALIYTLEPIFATLWAVWLPGVLSPLIGIGYESERPGWETVWGGLLVIAGNALALVQGRKER